MIRSVFLNADYCQLGTLTASNEDAEYPIESVYASGEVFRSTGTTTSIELTLDSVAPINFAVIGYHNLTNSAVVTLTIKSSAVGSILYTGLISTNLKRFPKFYSEEIYYTGAYVKIDISDPTNPDGYIQINRIQIGKAFHIEDAINYGVGLSFNSSSESESKSVKMGSVGIFNLPVKSKNIWREFSASLELLTQEEAELLITLSEELIRLGSVYASLLDGHSTFIENLHEGIFELEISDIVNDEDKPLLYNTSISFNETENFDV